MFALDVASYTLNDSNESTIGFVKLVPAQQPGLFAPRGAFSLEVYGNHVVLFGGFTRNPTLAPFVGCAAPDSQCVAFNDLWMWAPGLPQAPLDANTCGGGLCGWALVQVLGTPPAPRFGHATGVMLNQMYVIGGTDAAGTVLSDISVYSSPATAWSPVAATGALPARGLRRRRPLLSAAHGRQRHGQRGVALHADPRVNSRRRAR